MAVWIARPAGVLCCGAPLCGAALCGALLLRCAVATGVLQGGIKRPQQRASGEPARPDQTTGIGLREYRSKERATGVALADADMQAPLASIGAYAWATGELLTCVAQASSQRVILRMTATGA